MPWKVSGVVEKRKQFVEQWLAEDWTMTELCARHGISRQAGYNTLAHYQQAGWEGLGERSRAPRRHPNQTQSGIEQQIVELRHQHMRWGPRKLKVVLARQQPDVTWPAASTMGELLRREGLVIARKKRRRMDPYTTPFASASEPNRVWCGDFKGWSRTQDGERVDPLTISDACTRYLLRCQAAEKMDTARVRQPEHDTSLLVRRVHLRGQFSWKHHDVFLSETLAGERIGLEPIDDRGYTIYFAEFPLGYFDSRTRTVHRLSAAAGFYKADAGEGEPPPSPAPHPQNPDQKVSTMSPV